MRATLGGTRSRTTGRLGWCTAADADALRLAERFVDLPIGENVRVTLTAPRVRRRRRLPE